MRRLIWLSAVLVAFAVGSAAGGFFRSGAEVRRLQALVERQELQLSTLQARLRVREAPGPRANSVSQSAPGPVEEARLTSLPAGATDADPSSGPQRVPQRTAGAQRSDPPKDSGSPGSSGGVAPSTPPTVQAALDRFYRFLEEASGSGPARWTRTREVAADLRSMGDAGIEALMRVLGSGTSADE